ncbi:MAG TPA: SH3 domain-containing protein, partial [Aggregatilineales bacterium]|nr:SH3 domain-containing protein [Aggregatilineales bacterium]
MGNRALLRLIVGIGIVGLLMTGASGHGAALEAVSTPRPPSCTSAPKPHLEKGFPAQVTKQVSADLPGAYLKAEPTHNGPVLRYLPIDTVVKVVDGPKCGTDKNWWWQVKLSDDLTGWLVEASAGNYLLEPFTDTTLPTPPATTLLAALPCIRPNTPPSFNTTDKPTITRVAFGLLDGRVEISDDGGVGRVLATFSPPPLGIDLAPDGSAVLVTNANGLYWVDAQSGTTVMLLDSTMLALGEGMWINRVTWLPNGQTVAIEVKDTRDNSVSIQLWGLPLDGHLPAFREDTLPPPEAGVHKNLAGDHAVVVSSGDISPFPKDMNDDPTPYLEFVPKASESGDAREIVAPAVSWSTDGKGFYTYIPVSDNAAPDDVVAGRLWYVPWDDKPKAVAKLPGIKANDYVIPNRDGSTYLVGHGTTWAIRDLKGKVVQTLPALYYLFDWTPDGKGVIYGLKTGETKFQGVDSSDTQSAFMPDATNLYELKWLADGTILYVAQGSDGKLSFSTQKPGETAKFMGIVNTEYAFAAIQLPKAPDSAVAPVSCLENPSSVTTPGAA